MADCQETLNELHRYLDEELSADRVEEILSHLKVCTDCQEAFEFHAVLRDTIREKAKRDEISDDFLDRLQNCFGDDVLGGDLLIDESPNNESGKSPTDDSDEDSPKNPNN